MYFDKLSEEGGKSKKQGLNSTGGRRRKGGKKLGEIKKKIATLFACLQ